MESTAKPTPKEIKKAIDTIVRYACFSPYPTPQSEAEHRAALDLINSLEPEAARAAIERAETLIDDYYA
jgi:hypothetical protein